MANESAISHVHMNSILKAEPEIHVWNSAPETENEVIRLLKEAPILYSSYRGLNEEWKQKFLDFCQGKKTLPLTYDPFFKRIFHPDVHPDRLSRFISSILGITVRVLHVLPNEDSMLDGSSLLIMDILGELEDGALVNVEIQKQGYAFSAERISCYSADLLMRQYARVKGIKGSGFTYRDIKKVYVIVIYENSTKEFHKCRKSCLHLGKTTFNTDLDVELLQEYALIALDVFRKFPYPRDRNEQTAWLSLLITENLEDARKLIMEYPWLQEIYEEIAMFRQRPEEVLGMFSEALRILDQNTVKYMIEELQKELDEKEAALAAALAAAEKDKAAALAAEKEKAAALAAAEKEKAAALAAAEKEKAAALAAAEKEKAAALAAAKKEKAAALAAVEKEKEFELAMLRKQLEV